MIREGKHEKGIRKRALRFEKLGGLSEQGRSARAAKGRRARNCRFERKDGTW